MTKRKKLRIAMVAVFGLVFGFEAGAESTGSETFFRPAPDAGAELPADRLFPQGRMFPFAYFSVGGGSPERTNALLPEDQVQADLRRTAADGLRVLGPQYELNDRILEDAARHGFMALYTLCPLTPDGTRIGIRDLSEYSLDALIASLREQLEAVLAREDHTRIAWWYIQPEELRPWRRGEMDYLEAAVAVIRELDPLERPVWMYDPNHRSAGSLAATASKVDIVGKGMYVNYVNQHDQRVWCRWTIEQQNEGIARANPRAISIAVPEMFQQPSEDRIDMIPSWVRHDVYCALAADAQGVVVFSYRRRPNFEAHETYYQAYARIQQELCGEMGLGQVFLFGQRRDDLSVQVVDGPETVEMIYPSGGVREPIEYPSVSVANIAYGRDRYLFLVNSSNEPVRVEVSGLPSRGVAMRDAFDGTPPPPGVGISPLSVRMDPLGVRGIRFSRR